VRPCRGVSTTSRRGRPKSKLLSAYQLLRREAARYGLARKGGILPASGCPWRALTIVSRRTDKGLYVGYPPNACAVLKNKEVKQWQEKVI